MMLKLNDIERTGSEGEHFRISFTDWKTDATLYNIINSSMGKYCSVYIYSFPLNVLKSYNEYK